MQLLIYSALLALAAPNGPKDMLIEIAAVIFVLGVLVFVHELGHYLVAKWCGVRVEVFSLGFGKRLIGFRRGETDYRISALPIGGYVKMAGENPMEDRTGDPGEFMSHPRWQRFLVAIAGPAMNIILAIAVLTSVYMVRHEYPAFFDQAPKVGWVLEGSAAQKAGFQAGDLIVSVQGKGDLTWGKVFDQVVAGLEDNLDVEVVRDGQTKHLNVPAKTPEKEDAELLGSLGFVPAAPAIVDVVEVGKPAERAGIQPGDQIVEVRTDTVRSETGLALVSVLQATKDKPIQVSVLRVGQRKEFTLTPQLLPGADGKDTYRMGVSVSPEYLTEQLSFAPAVKNAATDCKKGSTAITRLVGKLFVGKASVKSFSGPVGIARESGRQAKLGFIPLMQFMALISLNLAIFNMLPIPILDGGLMLMLLIESIMRRDIKQEVKERVYQAAFVFLVLFAAVVIYNDIAKSFHG